MKIKCDYCGNYIDDTKEKCPECGSVNKNVKRVANGVPTTMEELERFANEKGLPLRKMRFFIGEDFRGPRAYGIYKDIMSGDYIVYKNHSDSSRGIRYKGPDEAYAVNELYQKLKAEAGNQLEKNPKLQSKNSSSNKPSNAGNSKNGVDKYRHKAGNTNRAKNLDRYYTIKNIKASIRHGLDILGDIVSTIIVLGPVVIPAIIFIIAFIEAMCSNISDSLHDGYYDYNGNSYVSYHGNWYEYIDDAWQACEWDDDIEFLYNHRDYRMSSDYSSDYGFSDFKDSSTYSEIKKKEDSSSSSNSWSSWLDDDDDDWGSSWSNWNSNWNNDNWDFDWDDWDSGYSNWNSNW